MNVNKVIQLIFGVVALLAAGCAILPPPPKNVPEVRMLPPAPAGLPAETALRFSERYPKKMSGFMPLSGSAEALNWRLALMDEATSTIDVQYFIWQRDEVGLLLFDRLLKAADRGVRVRFLVDDMAFAPTGRSIASICRHPSFEIKIFNPGRVRSTVGGMIEFLADMKTLNRRMHNKLMVVDNRMAIMGGRNIGNEYFGLGKKYNFRDLDVLVVGQVVPELSLAFDTYWNADASYPGGAMSNKAGLERLDAIRADTQAFIAESKEALAAFALAPKNWRQAFEQLPADLYPGIAYFIQDKPVRIGQDDYRLVDMLGYMSEPNEKELTLVTPYLIPSGDQLAKLVEATAKGVKVTFLVPSMGANNHTIAHSHYKKYRRKLLEKGANLFEFKHHPSAGIRGDIDIPPVRATFTCLHVKALVGDRKRCFVGSLNIDPRAIALNTENGLYIESQGFCGELAGQFDAMMSPENSWRVYLNEDKDLRWESSDGTVSSQPARGFGQRISDFFYRMLPLESQL